eukprot:scaffold7714_cov25-Tisochrysis_lutea.AAC.6
MQPAQHRRCRRRARRGRAIDTVDRRSLLAASIPSSGGSPRKEGTSAPFAVCADGLGSASRFNRANSALKAAAAGVEFCAERRSRSDVGESHASITSGGSRVRAPGRPYGSLTDLPFLRISSRSACRSAGGKPEAATVKVSPSAAPAAAKKERHALAETRWTDGRGAGEDSALPHRAASECVSWQECVRRGLGVRCSGHANLRDPNLRVGVYCGQPACLTDSPSYHERAEPRLVQPTCLTESPSHNDGAEARMWTGRGLCAVGLSLSARARSPAPMQAARVKASQAASAPSAGVKAPPSPTDWSLPLPIPASASRDSQGSAAMRHPRAQSRGEMMPSGGSPCRVPTLDAKPQTCHLSRRYGRPCPSPTPRCPSPKPRCARQRA